MNKYYFAIDNSTQWFSILVEVDEKDNIISRNDYLEYMGGEFLSNITNREMNFTNKNISNNYYYGWSLSRLEYDRLKKIIDLAPYVLEFERLRKIV
jgi:hypothetical protein